MFEVVGSNKAEVNISNYNEIKSKFIMHIVVFKMKE